MAYAHVPDCERRKLDTKSEKMRFVGYNFTSKGYRLFDETNRKLYVPRDVEFNESDFGQKSAMTTEPCPKSMEVKQKIGDQRPKNSKNSEDLREHPRHLSDMVTTNMQTPTTCAMFPII